MFNARGELQASKRGERLLQGEESRRHRGKGGYADPGCEAQRAQRGKSMCFPAELFPRSVPQILPFCPHALMPPLPNFIYPPSLHFSQIWGSWIKGSGRNYPSAPAPSIQYRASNLDWQLISYMIFTLTQLQQAPY